MGIIERLVLKVSGVVSELYLLVFMKFSSRIRFLVQNGAKGLVWMLVLLLAYFLFEHYIISKNPELWVERFYSQPLLVYLIYCGSELMFGIFPPELFLLWAINKGSSWHYLWNLTFFAGISYLMGYVNFLIGSFFYKQAFFKRFKESMLKEQWPKLKKYGLFLIVVAALTPLPWAAISMLVGSAGYPSGRYLKYALFRILRFAIYGYIVFQTHQF